METNVTPENTSLEALLRELRPIELDFLRARLDCDTDSEAAQRVGLDPTTVYKWESKATIRQALALIKQDGVMLAREILRRGAAEAAEAIVADVRHREWRARHDSAAQILDRLGVKAPAQLDVTSGGQPIPIREIVVERPG